MAQHENDPALRYTFDKMRAAWRQKQYRTRNGQQVAFQLPPQVQAGLTRLAKMRQQPKVQTLRQVISDAAREQDRAKKQINKVKEERKRTLQKMQATYQDKENTYRGLIDTLLNALAEEIHQRCCLEVQAGSANKAALEGKARQDYLALVDSRTQTIENCTADFKLLRWPNPLRQRIAKHSGIS